MSKRKVDAALDSKAAGKRRVDTEEESDDVADDDLLDGLLGQEFGDNDDDAEPINEDALAAMVDGDLDDGDLDDGDCSGSELLDDESFVGDGDDDDDEEEVADALPFPESELDKSKVDLSEHELTLAEARRCAQLLAANESLCTIRFSDHEIDVETLREDDELEWDSEEYGDIEAIIIAELLKGNTVVKRLDLARNQIADAGARALCTMLAENECIEYLNLESNTFGEKGGIAFCAMLGGNSTLQYFNLKENSIPSSTQQVRRRATPPQLTPLVSLRRATSHPRTRPEPRSHPAPLSSRTSATLGQPGSGPRDSGCTCEPQL